MGLNGIVETTGFAVVADCNPKRSPLLHITVYPVEALWGSIASLSDVFCFSFLLMANRTYNRAEVRILAVPPTSD